MFILVKNDTWVRRPVMAKHKNIVALFESYGLLFTGLFILFL